MDGPKAHVAHFEAMGPSKDMAQSAEAIIMQDRELGVIANIRRHWRAVLISSVAFTAGLAFGYDNVNSGASISMPSFILYFGEIGPTGPFLPSIWTSLWTSMSMIMQAVGAIVVGWPSDKIGRKWPSVGAAALTLVGAGVQYVAIQRATLMGGKMITGFGIGALMATATTYIGEVAPIKLRAPLQTCLVIFVIFTQGLALGIVRVFVPHIEESAFRTVFATQWAVGGVAFLAWLVAPESPVWLIRKGKIDAARKTMRLIYGPNNHAEERLEYEIHAIRLEEANESINKGNYISCFRGYHLKRTATVAFLYSTHNTGGAAFLAQNIYFLIIAGLEAIHAFDIGIGGFALAIIIVLASGAYLQRISRRNVVLAGLVINFLIMVVIGGLYWATSNGGLWAIAVLMNILISLQTSMLLGAGWPIAAELSSYHLRAKTLSIGVVSQTLTSWLFNFITPYMYNVDSGNLGAKTGFIYAGTSLLLIVGGWYLIPDTTGMTTEEIDGAYEAGVSPRAFQSFRTHVPNAVDKEMG